jgi:hypothetical protein
LLRKARRPHQKEGAPSRHKLRILPRI